MLGALGGSPYERKRKSTLRKVQVEEGFGLGFIRGEVKGLGIL